MLPEHWVHFSSRAVAVVSRSIYCHPRKFKWCATFYVSIQISHNIARTFLPVFFLYICINIYETIETDKYTHLPSPHLSGYIFSFATISPGPNPGSDAISKLEFPSTIDSVPSHQSELEDFEECTLFNHYTHFLPNATVLQEPFSYPAVTVRR